MLWHGFISDRRIAKSLQHLRAGKAEDISLKERRRISGDFQEISAVCQGCGSLEGSRSEGVRSVRSTRAKGNCSYVPEDIRLDLMCVYTFPFPWTGKSLMSLPNL